MDNLFRKEYFIGYVNHVNPQYIYADFPSLKQINNILRDDNELAPIVVGEYVIIEGRKSGFLGKILELDSPKKDHLFFEEDIYSDFSLSAKVEIIVSFEFDQHIKTTKGLMSYPSIWDKIYYCSKGFIEDYLKNFGMKYKNTTNYLYLGKNTNNYKSTVRVSGQSFFSRHCAIVGTTGAGKSWTIAKLIEQMNKNNSKSILIDPTGEYESIVDDQFKSVVIAESTFFHYRNLTIEDLFYLIKPSGNLQMPKLLEAIRSLKAFEVDKLGALNEYKVNGVLRKANKKKAAFEEFYFKNIDKIGDAKLNFDIKYLSAQITQECIFDTDKNNPEKYGVRNEEAVSRCVNLISRTSNLLHTEIFKDAFGFKNDVNSRNELTKIIDEFLESDKKVLRIGFERIGFDFQAREIIANAIGKYLLEKAREYIFRENPLVIFVDEAHQFLNKTVVDDYFKGSSLTAFEQIAKECRKYGLFMCIATQVPRDIPMGTLSQMGTFVVHRLINSYDKDAISHACSSATDNILAFLPVLGEGEAILTGVDFPMDLTIKIGEPILKPNSKTPLFINVIEE